MNKFTFLVLLALSVAPLVSIASEEDESLLKHTFVIVHGATGGGWDWREVSDHLAESGHTAYRPTLTGLGERFHLASADIDLTTHVNDVVNSILFEDLNEVILVGHSYGGMVITGVMDRIPDRISHATFLDAAVPDDGMSALEVWGAKVEDYKVVDGQVYFPWLKLEESLPRDVPQPLKTITEPVSFSNPSAQKIDVSYVAFLPEGVTEQQRSQDSSWQRALKRGYTIRTFSGDHVIYREKPSEMAELLIEASKDRNKPASQAR